MHFIKIGRVRANVDEISPKSLFSRLVHYITHSEAVSAFDSAFAENALPAEAWL